MGRRCCGSPPCHPVGDRQRSAKPAGELGVHIACRRRSDSRTGDHATSPQERVSARYASGGHAEPRSYGQGIERGPGRTLRSSLRNRLQDATSQSQSTPKSSRRRCSAGAGPNGNGTSRRGTGRNRSPTIRTAGRYRSRNATSPGDPMSGSTPPLPHRHAAPHTGSVKPPPMLGHRRRRWAPSCGQCLMRQRELGFKLLVALP